MKNESSAERPLDPTTARIVAELAEAFLPRLKAAVVEELSTAVRVLPQKTGSEIEETVMVLERLRDAGERVLCSLTAVEKVTGETAAVIQTEVGRLLRALEPAIAQIGGGVETAVETIKLLRLLEAAIPAWEGVLKADGRAHTRELSDLSSEITELLRDTRASLLTEVRTTVEKELEKHDERVEQLLREAGKRTDRKLAVLQKAIGVSVVLFLAVSALILTLLLK